MNKRDFITRVSEEMRRRNIRKPVSIPKQVFHISDNEGNSKDFTIKSTDKSVLYNRDDVEAVVETCLYYAQECLKKGEPISFRGFGTLEVKYKKPRTAKNVYDGTEIIIEGRYSPKFTFGNELRMCAKMYELSLKEKLDSLPGYEYDMYVEDELGLEPRGLKVSTYHAAKKHWAEREAERTAELEAMKEAESASNEENGDDS